VHAGWSAAGGIGLPPENATQGKPRKAGKLLKRASYRSAWALQHRYGHSVSCVRALVYPVTSNGIKEQSVRAEKLARMGVLDLIGPEELAPEKLAQKVGAALRNEPTRLL